MSRQSLAIEQYRQKVGKKLGVSKWLTVTQEMIDGFARVTLDPDPMHIDPEWCKEHSPFGVPIAFGFLTVSLLTCMLREALEFASHSDVAESYGLNYGIDKLRMVAPVRVGSRIRGHFTLGSLVERKPGEHIQSVDVVVEIEGQDKPALVATWLAILVDKTGHERLTSQDKP